MSQLTDLGDFKKKIDVEIEKYLDRVIKETKKRDAVMTDAVRYVKKMVMASGKRLRPAFMYYGYLAAGGREKEKMLKTAVSIELIHIFLLIHDDIIDRDNIRHGVDSIHKRYEKLGKKIFREKDCGHFGDSMAIIIGDMVGALGNQVIFESEFKPALVMKALYKLQGIVSLTCVGEAQDVYIEYRGRASEKEILKMYENKTAKYTVEGPLHLGAILGGASESTVSGLSRYALPLGIAFQIQDDILGVFGNEAKLGKKVGADIIEGKQTLLVARAMKMANKAQKKSLKKILGNPQLDKKGIDDFRKIIKETGAYDYARNMSLDLVAEARKELSKMQLKNEAERFLGDVAEYMVRREL